MQAGLSVENHHITVSQMSLDYVTHAKLDLAPGGAYGDFISCFCGDEIGPAAFVAAAEDALFEEIH